MPAVWVFPLMDSTSSVALSNFFEVKVGRLAPTVSVKEWKRSFSRKFWKSFRWRQI